MVRAGNAIQTFQPILPYRQLGSPFIRLTGDEFCANAESSLYLLENTNSAIGGTALTNNASATFSLDTAYGNTVANLVSASSQYFSLPTEASVQLGTGSFIIKIDFKTPSIGGTLAGYGDVNSGAYWYLQVNGTNQLKFSMGDGTNSATDNETIAGRWTDNMWHTAIVLVDRVSNICYLTCDGNFIFSFSISNVTGTLTQAGASLYLGALKATSVQQFHNGSLANFHLIKAADYNAVGVLNQGIREPVMSGAGFTLSTESNSRFNNQFFNSSAASGDYTYALVNVEAGTYELQTNTQTNNNAGILQILIDNVQQLSNDNYSASLTRNVYVKKYNINLTEGQHLVKVLTNSKNASSSGFNIAFEWINLIKRKGHEEGGVDNALLLGDEISERVVGSWTLGVASTIYYNNLINQNTNSDLQYIEGTLFIKGGLYRVELYWDGNTNRGTYDLWFGNVKAITIDENTGASTNNLAWNNVRLQQGKQVVRLTGNGKSGTGYTGEFLGIRFTRLSD